ncbi:hypothetical protein HDU90_006003 [Geranomyces variabilis]|nr:hypothetical protein HDU90_006003 [Geranomyces variabilis]
MIGKMTRILVQYPQLLPAVSGVVKAGVSDRVVKILELEAILQKTPGALEDPEVSGVFNSLCRSLKPLATKPASPVSNQPPSAIRHSPLALPLTESAPAEVVVSDSDQFPSQVQHAGADGGKIRTSPRSLPAFPQDAPAKVAHVTDDGKMPTRSPTEKPALLSSHPPSAVFSLPTKHDAPAEVVHVPADDSKIVKESSKRKFTELEENDKTISASTASTIEPLSPVVAQAKRAKPSAKRSSPRKKVSTTDVRNDRTTSKPLEPPANQSSPRPKITSPEPEPEEVTFPSPALVFEAQVAAMCVTRAGKRL